MDPAGSASLHMRRSKLLYQRLLTAAAAGLTFSPDIMAALDTDSASYSQADFRQLFRPTGVLQPAAKTTSQRKRSGSPPRPKNPPGFRGQRSEVRGLLRSRPRPQGAQLLQGSHREEASGSGKPIHQVDHQNQNQITSDDSKYQRRRFSPAPHATTTHANNIQTAGSVLAVHQELQSSVVDDPDDPDEPDDPDDPVSRDNNAVLRDSVILDADGWTAAQRLALDGDDSRLVIQRILAQLLLCQDQPDPQNQLPDPQDQLPDPQNQLPDPQNQLPDPQDHLPDPQDQLPDPQNQLPDPQDQLPDPKKQLPDPQNHLPDPQNHLPDPKKQLPDPQNQLPDPQDHLPDPQDHLPDPQNHVPDPQNHLPDPKKQLPDPQNHLPDPQNHLPDPQDQLPDPQDHLPDPQDHLPDPQDHLPDPQNHLPDPKKQLPDPQNHLPDPQNHLPDPKKQLPDPQNHLPDPQNHLSDPQNHLPDPQNHLPDPQLVVSLLTHFTSQTTLVRSLLAEHLNRSEHRTRLLTCDSLSGLQWPINKDVVHKLIHLMCNDQSYVVRCAAAEALMTLGNVQHVHYELRLKLEERRGLQSRMEALDLISRLKITPVKLLQLVASCLADEVASVRQQACMTAASLLLKDNAQRNEVVRRLLELMEDDPAPEVRLSAINAVGALGLSAAGVQEALRRCVETEEEEELQLAARQLLQPSDELQGDDQPGGGGGGGRLMTEEEEEEEERRHAPYRLQMKRRCELQVLTEKVLLLEKLQDQSYPGRHLKPAALAELLTQRYTERRY